MEADQWKEIDPAADVSPSPLPFTEVVGPTPNLPGFSQPVEYFRHLFDDQILHLLVEETNRYVVRCILRSTFTVVKSLQSFCIHYK